MRRRLAATLLAVALLAGFQGAVQAEDTHEVNDTRNQAATVSLGSEVRSYIGVASDVDYFRVAVPGKGKLKLRLVVPDDQDYDVLLVNRDGQELARGARGRGEVEEVEIDVRSDDYYIKIYPYGGSYSDTVAYRFTTDFTTVWI